MNMTWQILIAHADGEEEIAERLAEPLRDAGYEVSHRGTVMVGESFAEEAAKVLDVGGPVVLCGTIKALGSVWAHRIVSAARVNSTIRVFAVQIDKDAYIQQLYFRASKNDQKGSIFLPRIWTSAPGARSNLSPNALA
jgi:hypothetical protein